MSKNIVQLDKTNISKMSKAQTVLCAACHMAVYVSHTTNVRAA